MAKKKRKYYSGKELLYRRQLERQQAEAEEKTNNIRVRQLHQINASSRAIGWAKQKMREGATMQLEYKEDGNMTLWYLRFFYKEN